MEIVENVVKKAGTVLVDLQSKKIGLIYRKKAKDFSFPKGHVEVGESLVETAQRETEEETGRKCHLHSDGHIGIIEYKNFEGDIVVYFYLAIDDGKTDRNIAESDKEVLVWKDVDEVEICLSHQNLKTFWVEVREEVEQLLN